MSTQKSNNQFGAYLAVPLPPKKTFENKNNNSKSLYSMPKKNYMSHNISIQNTSMQQSKSTMAKSASQTELKPIKKEKVHKSKKKELDPQDKIIYERICQSHSPSRTGKSNKISKFEKEKMKKIKEVLEYKKQAEVLKKKSQKQQVQKIKQIQEKQKIEKEIKELKLQEFQDNKDKRAKLIKKETQKNKGQLEKNKKMNDLHNSIIKHKLKGSRQQTEEKESARVDKSILSNSHHSQKEEEKITDMNKLYKDDISKRQSHVNKMMQSNVKKKVVEVEEDPFEKKMREKEERDRLAQEEFKRKSQANIEQPQ